MLVKLGWFLATGNKSLWSQALTEKYCKNVQFWNCENKTSDSLVLWGISETWEIVTKRACYLIGTREGINFWNNPWIPWHSDCPYELASDRGWDQNLKDFYPKPYIKDLLCPSTRDWDKEVKSFFNVSKGHRIYSVRHLLYSHPNKLIWKVSKSGVFNPKSCYHIIISNRILVANLAWKFLWKTKIHERLNFFLWRGLSDLLPTSTSIIRSQTECCVV